MIEMLGVLAIIGVLSVGGIAGYSKAMDKWKINKAIEEYGYLIYGLQDHLNYIYNLTEGGQVAGVVNLANSLDLIPKSWKVYNNAMVTDAYGNMFGMAVFPAAGGAPARINMDIYIGRVQNSDKSYSYPEFYVNLCRAFFTNLFIPESNSIWAAATVDPTHKYQQYYAKSYCNGTSRPCLHDLTITKIDEICRSCVGTKQLCRVDVSF